MIYCRFAPMDLYQCVYIISEGVSKPCGSAPLDTLHELIAALAYNNKAEKITLHKFSDYANQLGDLIKQNLLTEFNKQNIDIEVIE